MTSRSAFDFVRGIRALLHNYNITNQKLALELADYCASQMLLQNDVLYDAGRIVCPESGLELPPELPEGYMPFSARTAKYGTRIGVREFIEKEQPWSKYASKKLLYSASIRVLDPSLYKAMTYQARVSNSSMADYAIAFGILTKEYLRQPPPGFERQAKLLRAVKAAGMATAMANGLRKSAQGLLQEL